MIGLDNSTVPPLSGLTLRRFCGGPPRRIQSNNHGAALAWAIWRI